MPTDQERIATLEAQISNHGLVIETISADVKDIKERLLGRPSWFVLLVITSSFTVIGAMAMYIVTL